MLEFFAAKRDETSLLLIECPALAIHALGIGNGMRNGITCQNHPA